MIIKDKEESRVEEVSKETMQNAKGYKITIIDLDTNETVLDKVSKGIMGSILDEENGIIGIHATKCETRKVVALIDATERTVTEGKKIIIEKLMKEVGGKKHE